VSEPPLLLALDQGTTSTRAMAFSTGGAVVAQAQLELPQSFPRPGWVEHDPARIAADAWRVLRDVAAAAGNRSLATLGITNQRETTVLWDRRTGQPVHPAIVWQDRRTADTCADLRAAGHGARVAASTGLVLDPYFSATKLAWLLDNVEGARARAKRGDLAFGTIDTWLVWTLTGGRVHATDASNASRTMLFDIGRQCWDADLLRLFDIPAALLPDVRDSDADFGTVTLDGRTVPIRAVLGDQQAATFGQAAFHPGMVKSTYGTGAFVLLNTGTQRLQSRHNLLTTVAWRRGGAVTYALEGAIFMAGATVQWLRDGLGVIASAAECDSLAASQPDSEGVYLVPAFTGLGAPWWDAEARGAIMGLTRASGRAHLARAALEAVGYQTRDLLAAMTADGAPAPAVLRVDGGLARSDLAMQFLADQLAVAVARPTVTETTARGVAWAAGIAAGLLDDAAVERAWQQDREFQPAMAADRRETLYAGWRRAVRRTLSDTGQDP
jgi:glycerol kinase